MKYLSRGPAGDGLLDAWQSARRQYEQAACSSPAAFRRFLMLHGDKRRLDCALLSWQREDFEALDPAWRMLATREGSGNVTRRAWLERPRGHSKTTDIAAQLLWILLAARRSVNGLVAAADLEQALLVHRAMQRLRDANPLLLRSVTFLENSVRNGTNRSFLKIVSSDVRGSWGELPDFVVCDELCHWKSPDLWYSLLSSAAKRPESVLIVLSNAGIGRGWQWDAREAARTSPAWYFSSLEGPQAPWITAESLDEQKRLLPPAVFARLWLNQWQHSDGEFVSLAEAAACRDESLVCREHGEPGRDYVATIDYAEKRDLTVGCVCHREGSTLVVDRMDVVRPGPDTPTPVRWVTSWMHSIASRFPSVQFVVDAHQLASVIQELQDHLPIERYEFLGGQANYDMALTLRQLILERTLHWYPGCGVIPGEEQNSPPDNLETELASLIVREMPGGRFRFDHRCDGRHHDDRAFALGAACQKLLTRPAQNPIVWEVQLPGAGGLSI